MASFSFSSYVFISTGINRLFSLFFFSSILSSPALKRIRVYHLQPHFLLIFIAFLPSLAAAIVSSQQLLLNNSSSKLLNLSQVTNSWWKLAIKLGTSRSDLISFFLHFPNPAFQSQLLLSPLLLYFPRRLLGCNFFIIILTTTTLASSSSSSCCCY